MSAGGFFLLGFSGGDAAGEGEGAPADEGGGQEIELYDEGEVVIPVGFGAHGVDVEGHEGEAGEEALGAVVGVDRTEAPEAGGDLGGGGWGDFVHAAEG